MLLGDILITLLVLLIYFDVWYKTAHTNCSPNAPWYLQATLGECKAIAEKAAEARQEALEARRLAEHDANRSLAN